MIAVATTQTRLEGYHVTAYKGIAQGETYLALLRDAEALGANAVLNTCFDDALDFLQQRVSRRPALADRLRLVHGIVLAPPGTIGLAPDTRYAHAWVLDGDVVWQAGLLNDIKIAFGVALDVVTISGIAEFPVRVARNTK